MQAAPSELVLQRLQSTYEAEFGVLADLYAQAFPETERKPVAVLRRMLAMANYHFFLATQNSLTVGFAILRVLGDGDAALLEYMAVAPERRGRGLGGRLLLAAAKAIDAPPLTLLLEVESDRVESPDRAARTSRKRFYRSLGARELQDLSWIMPPVIATPPPPMEMMVFGAASNAVSKRQLRRWLAGIYGEVYGQAADDSRIETMLSELPESVPLV